MISELVRTLRYAWSWKHGSTLTVEETEIDRDGERIPATFLTPADHGGGLPGWIVLGGVTSKGRHHPQLARFAAAMAASGAGVIVPEVPEWRDLRLAPGATEPTVMASVKVLRNRPEVGPGKLGLIGFSFGAAQAAIASARRALAEELGVVVLFGGYCDLERTLRCQLTGLHEWDGTVHRLDPDPYGRWVLASNYLTRIPGCEDAGDVAEALRRLALASTEQRIPAWDRRHDPLRDDLRSALPPRRRHHFDLFAPPTAAEPEPEAAEEMAVALAAACRRADPLLDPATEMEGMCVPIRLFHGRSDRLVPFTESLRFHERLPDGLESRVTVTGLFAHSADTAPPSAWARIQEGGRFTRALHEVINAV